MHFTYQAAKWIKTNGAKKYTKFWRSIKATWKKFLLSTLISCCFVPFNFWRSLTSAFEMLSWFCAPLPYKRSFKFEMPFERRLKLLFWKNWLLQTSELNCTYHSFFDSSFYVKRQIRIDKSQTLDSEMNFPYQRSQLTETMN